MRLARRGFARLTALLILVVCAPATPTLGAPKWLRVTSPHFVIVGNTREADLRAVGRRLEQFREVFVRTFPKANAQAPVPAVVVVFERDAGLTPYKPLYQGKPRELTGFFQPGPDVNSIALSLEHAEQALPLVFHELSHAILSNSMTWVPAWFGEGFAEYYGTFEISTDGFEATLGKPSSQSLVLLRQRALVPLHELLTADPDSALYNEWDRRELFYAESWSLVHYLLRGSPERKGQLSEYLTRVGAGAPSPDAARAAFGDLSALEHELTSYVRRRIFNVTKLRFTTPVVTPEMTADALTEGEVEGYLGELLVRQRRIGEALPRLAAALQRAPRTARIHGAIGLAHLYDERYAEAAAAFRAAVEQQPGDALFQYQLGRALVMDSTQGKDAAALEAARVALARAIALQPDLPDANALLGNAMLVQGADPATARPYLARAVELVPASEQYRLALAQLCMAERRWDEARRVLGPIAAASRVPQMKEAARDLLGRTATLERAEREAAAASTSTAATARVAGDVEERLPARIWVVNVPPPREGEHQARGRWLSLECGGPNGVVRVRIDERTAAYLLRAPDAVQFTWWRPDKPDTLACGPRGTPELVVVTWKPFTEATPPQGLDGELVRLDVVPEETEPPE